MERAVYIISGIPGAGKTTVSGLLARRFERGVHIEADLLQRMIVAGGLWPDGEPQDEAQRQLLLRARNACTLADSYFHAGFTVIVDYGVVGARLDEFREQIRGRPLRFVLLTPELDVVRHRDATRAVRHVFDKWGYLDEVMRRDTPKVGLWLDSSAQTAEETVDEILRRAKEAEIA
jgi:adenylate kinase family enzyme